MFALDESAAPPLSGHLRSTIPFSLPSWLLTLSPPHLTSPSLDSASYAIGVTSTITAVLLFVGSIAIIAFRQSSRLPDADAGGVAYGAYNVVNTAKLPRHFIFTCSLIRTSLPLSPPPLSLSSGVSDATASVALSLVSAALAVAFGKSSGTLYTPEKSAKGGFDLAETQQWSTMSDNHSKHQIALVAAGESVCGCA